MIEKLTCPVCGQTIQSDKTHQFDDSKSVTCNACKLKSQLGQWRVAINRSSEVVPPPPQIESRPPTLPLPPKSIQSQHKQSSDVEGSTVVQPPDKHLTIALWIGAVGLLLVCLAPFFKWISIGAGGMIGLAGDGKFLLVVTTFAVAAFVVSIARKNLMIQMILPVQLWGIVVAFWMGGLLWKLSSLSAEDNVKDNLFAAMLSTMLVSPGIGLYIGLVGGLSIAGALGYVTAIKCYQKNRMAIFVALEAVALCVGIGAVVFLAPNGIGKSAGPTFGERPHFGSLGTKKEPVVKAELKKTFTLGNLQITPLRFELLTLREKPTFGEMQSRKLKSFVFSFSAKNISEGEVFEAFTTSEVKDNFGNMCPDLMRNEPFAPSVFLESNEILKEIGPGESAVVKIAFDPKIQSATEYTCTLTTKTSNQDGYKQWTINYSPNGSERN